MIAPIDNRPALQVGHVQVFDYDTSWLDAALQRAAAAAEIPDFPFLGEIRHGVEDYLENKCPHTLLPLPTLFDRLRRMLHQIGCPRMAESLQPMAPPIYLSLSDIAQRADHGFELAFFQLLREELEVLRREGAEEIHFMDLAPAVRFLCQASSWTPRCARLHDEVRCFLMGFDRTCRDTAISQ